MDNIDDSEYLNYEKLLEKAQNITNSWAQRNFTIIGKVQIVNSLENLIFVYMLQVLLLMSKTVLGQINRIVSRFIWNTRKPKMRNEQLYLEYDEGGVKLSNIEIQDQALKCDWVRKITQRTNCLLNWHTTI